VQPTLRAQGLAINADQGLEGEADAMGRQAGQFMLHPSSGHQLPAHRAGAAAHPIQSSGVIQANGWDDFLPGKNTTAGLGVAGALGAIALYRYLTQDQRKHTDLAQRMAELERYQHQGGNGADQRLDTQYQRLYAVEQEAHAWLRSRNRYASDTDRAAMNAVLDRLDIHRRTLVGHTLAGNHPLWLPDNVGGQQQARARALWDSIRQGQGNIDIQPVADGGAFRTNILADISKLLQSQHGRDMLDELDANQGGDAGRRIHIGANWDGIYSEDKRGDWARAIDDNPAANSPAHGEVGAGAGSYVQIEHGADDALHVGAHDQPIHSPSYITLGHELGHARRKLRGQAREDVSWDRPGDPKYDDLQQGDIEHGLWSDPEEFENITTEENPLRGQLGLPERQYHRAHQAVSLTRKREQMRQRYQAAWDRLGEQANDLPAYGEAALWALGYKNWDAPDALRDAEASIAQFEREVAARAGMSRRQKVGWGVLAGALALGGIAAYLKFGNR
jgi:hypothetical protein